MPCSVSVRPSWRTGRLLRGKSPFEDVRFTIGFTTKALNLFQRSRLFQSNGVLNSKLKRFGLAGSSLCINPWHPMPQQSCCWRRTTEKPLKQWVFPLINDSPFASRAKWDVRWPVVFVRLEKVACSAL